MQAQAAEAPKGNGKDQRVLMPDRMGLAEAKRHDWVVDAEFGTTLEQVMEPAFWSHVAATMVAGDHIEVRAEDMSWIAYLVVHFAERTYAKVVVDRIVKFEVDSGEPEVSIKHKVAWKGPHLKFCVIRVSDSQRMQSGFNTRAEADAWISNHEKVQ